MTPDSGDPPPLVFLDMDDVLCTNDPYGGYDVATPHPPADLWDRLFNPTAVSVLRSVIAEFNPRIVLTTSWLQIMDRAAFEQIFARTGLHEVRAALHEHCEALSDRGMTRLGAIERWLRQHHKGEPFVILDDTGSGTGLKGSAFSKKGRVVLCALDVGLQSGHMAQIRTALRPVPAPRAKSSRQRP